MIAQPTPAAAFRRRCLAAAAGLLRRLLYGVLIVAALALAAAMAVNVLPRLFGYASFVVSGGSMGDAVPQGTIALARWVAPSDVRVGDIIIARVPTGDRQPSPKVHRVLSVQRVGAQWVVQTKGDANAAVDPQPLVLTDRVPKLAYTVPYAGHLLNFVLTPLGWALAVLLPAALLCVLTLRGIWAPPKAKVGHGQHKPWAA